MLFVQRVVDFLDQLGDDLVNLVVLVGGFLRRAGNNQRRAGFVNQDGVHLVHDGKLMAALNTIGQVVLHVVTEIVETKLVVRAIGNVGLVCGAALVVVQVVDDNTHGQSQRAINRAHPFRVAARQVIVDGNDVDAHTGQRVQSCGESSHKRFAFACFNLRIVSLVEIHP